VWPVRNLGHFSRENLCRNSHPHASRGPPRHPASRHRPSAGIVTWPATAPRESPGLPGRTYTVATSGRTARVDSGAGPRHARGYRRQCQPLTSPRPRPSCLAGSRACTADDTRADRLGRRGAGARGAARRSAGERGRRFPTGGRFFSGSAGRRGYTGRCGRGGLTGSPPAPAAVARALPAPQK
jgi:hypothetical protein